jgi:signal transduction histidine kinase
MEPGAEPITDRLLSAVLALADLSLPVVLRRIVESARELVNARYCALGVIGPDGRLSEFVHTGMSEDEVDAIGALPEGKGLLGVLIVDPQPLRLDDLHRHPDSYGFPPDHPPMTSFLGAPIRVRGQVFGNIYLCDKVDGSQFTADDERLVVGLAAAAGAAIENARLHAKVRDLDIVADRERIARELHDTVIQRLFAVGMALQTAARLASDGVATRIERAVDDLDETIRDIRSTIFALEAPVTASASLRADVLRLVADVTPALGFEPQLVLDGPIEATASQGLGEHLLAALREALTNVARHAEASKVDVSVVAGDELVLRVADDGSGMVDGDAEAGWSLRNLRARAEALGGTLALGRPDGGGTVLEWRVPADHD